MIELLLTRYIKRNL